MRVVFGHPRRCAVVVLDREAANDLLSYSLQGIDVEVLPSRREEFRVSARVAWHFLRGLALAAKDRPPLREAPGALYRAYLRACVLAMRPHAVVTMVDNSMAFQWMSRRCEGIRFIAVQNGARYRYDVTDWLPNISGRRWRISMPELVCFGAYEPSLYRQYGHDVDAFVPAGSFRAGVYRERRPKPPPSAVYDLCLVSQWTDEAGAEMFPAIAEGHARVSELFARYVSETGASACVALRSDSVGEAAFYRGLMGDAVMLRERADVLSVYETMDTAEVVVTFCSTAATEAFGWGARILCVNASGDDNYDFPSAGPWALGAASYEEFRDALDRVRATQPSDHLERSADARRYVMDWDPSRPAHRQVRERVLSALDKGGAVGRDSRLR